MLLRSPTRDHGYTLLELIVVIFIIGLISAVILLRSGTVRFERKASVYAQQLESFMQVCQQQALLQPAVIGVMVHADSYEAYYFADVQPSRWVALAGKDSFWQARPIPKDIFLRVTTSVALHAGVVSPQIIIQPSGDLTPFTIDVGYVNEAPHYRLTGNDAGEIFLQDLR